MIVSAVKQQMQARGRATVSQLAAELGESRERIAEVLQLHVERGRVHRETLMPEAGGHGTGCAHCPLADACQVDACHIGTGQVDTCQVGAPRDLGVEVYVWNKVENHE